MLTQTEADALLRLEKYDFSGKFFQFPHLGQSLRLELSSQDEKEIFNLDITRGSIVLEKITFQTRARKAVVLVRLDVAGPPHRNPDGEEIACPHLHIYREGFADKWAYPLPDSLMEVLDNPKDLLERFMDYCYIVGKPKITCGLFI